MKPEPLEHRNHAEIFQSSRTTASRDERQKASSVGGATGAEEGCRDRKQDPLHFPRGAFLRIATTAEAQRFGNEEIACTRHRRHNL